MESPSCAVALSAAAGFFAVLLYQRLYDARKRGPIQRCAKRLGRGMVQVRYRGAAPTGTPGSCARRGEQRGCGCDKLSESRTNLEPPRQCRRKAMMSDGSRRASRNFALSSGLTQDNPLGSPFYADQLRPITLEGRSRGKEQGAQATPFLPPTPVTPGRLPSPGITFGQQWLFPWPMAYGVLTDDPTTQRDANCHGSGRYVAFLHNFL
jgi:hypothetical protein